MRSVIPNFMTGKYKVKRQSKGYYKEGKYFPGATEELLIKGSLQPLNGREIKMEQEGDRLKDYFEFWSNAPLTVIDTRTLAKADVMEINGDTYKVIDVEKWQNQAGFGGISLPHYKTKLYREAQQ